MGKTVYSKKAKETAYEMYWKDRGEFVKGKKVGRYSLNEISRATGMHRTYISRIARGLK